MSDNGEPQMHGLQYALPDVRWFLQSIVVAGLYLVLSNGWEKYQEFRLTAKLIERAEAEGFKGVTTDEEADRKLEAYEKRRGR